MSINWTKAEWNRFLDKKGMGKVLDNKQLTRKVRILEEQVKHQRAWMASIVNKIKKGEI